MQRISVGGWEIHPELNQIARGGETLRLEPKVMDLLVHLAANPGRVLTKSEVMAAVWPDTVVSESALMSAVSDLRRAVGDDTRNPRILETIPRRGYRLVAPVEAAAPSEPESEPRPPRLRRRLTALLSVAALAALVAAASLDWRRWIPAAPRIESIAVLPFDDLSGDQKYPALAEAMTDAIITELGQVSGLRVISRQSILRYEGTEKPLPQIARELGVDALLEGAVVRSGPEVRVTAQVIRASPEGHLWSRSYERSLDDVLRLQGEIARDVARQTRVSLSPDEEKRLQDAREVTPEVYELYLEGRHLWATYRPDDLRESIHQFERALELDPDFAPAHVGLAEAYVGLGAVGATESNWTRVAYHAARAAELDPTLDEAHRLLALEAFYADWAWDTTEDELEQALRLNPSSAATLDQYANLLLVRGRLEEAVEVRHRNLVLDPLSHYYACNAGFTYYYARRYDEAMSRAESNLELFGPSCPNERLVIGKAAGLRRMYAEAIGALGAAPEPSAPHRLAELAYVLAVSGDRVRASEILEELEERASREPVDPALLAQVYVGLDDRQGALSQLEAGYEQRSFWMPFVAVEPKFDALRDEPRFAALVRRMGLSLPPVADDRPS